MSTGTLERVDPLTDTKDVPKCRHLLYRNSNWIQCENPARWSLLFVCPKGHDSVGIRCNPCKEMVFDPNARLVCTGGRCGFWPDFVVTAVPL